MQTSDVSFLGRADLSIAAVIDTIARRETLLWWIVVVAAVGDVATTAVGLHVGLVEGNPIVRGWIDNYGVWMLALSKVAIVGGGWLCTRFVSHPGRIVVPLGFALPWLFATGSNAVMIAILLI